MREIVVLVGFLAGCTRAANGGEAERAIEAHFEKFHAVTSVKCPSSIQMQVGAEFECDLVFGDGGTWHVGAKVTKTTAAGAAFDFKIKETFFDPTPVAAWIVETAKKQNADLKVDCGWPRLPKPEETCQVTLPDGRTTVAKVKVGEKAVPMSFEIDPM